MKLTDHVEHIRQLIDQAFNNRLGRMGLNSSQILPIESIPAEYKSDRRRIETIREVFIKETGSPKDAYEKLVEELNFTLFNRLAALKVMEAHTLHPEIITRRDTHGGRSFSHLAWLEENPDGRTIEAEGLIPFIEDQFNKISSDIPLFGLNHPYHLLPTAIEFKGIIDAFNEIEIDTQVEVEIWKSDDILGWLYESYNNFKKAAHKDSGEKTEYNKVSIQSQIYTPKWVVKFLVDNSLGKLYLEMYPDSSIKEKYKIANAPTESTRKKKPLSEIKLIDPAQGSANFLLYAFDLFYDLYLDQIENYGADYSESEIAKIIIEKNLHGIDLDDRAIQLGQLGLYIKAKRKKRTVKIDHFNIVSSDFFLPSYEEVKHLFENGEPLDSELEKIVVDLWGDLQQAYKFGSLIRLEEQFNSRIDALVAQFQRAQLNMFSEGNLANYENFRDNFLDNLKFAVGQNVAKQGLTFLNTKTQDAITFLDLLTQKYDVAVANPPYTDSSDFGLELKNFIDSNYKQTYKFNANLYASFIKRSFEIINENGLIGMLHPLTFMYISSFSEVRKFILTKTHIDILAEFGLGGVFANSDVQADVVAYVARNNTNTENGYFLDFKKYKNHSNKPEIFSNVYANLIENISDEHVYNINQNDFKIIHDWPFIYWISDVFRNQFKGQTIGDIFDVVQGLATADNERFTRFWWEVNIDNISNTEFDNKKWFRYSKGGPYCKWYGNNWAIINWEFDGKEVKDYRDANGKQKSRPQNERYYRRYGITYTRSGSKGASFRIHETNLLFDVGGACVFSKTTYNNYYYLISFLNSKLSKYILDCLNPTVNTTEGDMKKIPFVTPSVELDQKISELAIKNIEIKKQLCSYRIIEPNFIKSPLLINSNNSLKDRLISHVNFENLQNAKILINEAVINKLIFEVYQINKTDYRIIETNMGVSIGELPVLDEARKEFLEKAELNSHVYDYVKNLTKLSIEPVELSDIKKNLEYLYQGSSNIEEFCIKYQINPINIWHWFIQINSLPLSVAFEYSLEFLVNSFREILTIDDDGIIPLVGLPGEDSLSQRFEQYCLQKGFTSAQFLQLDNFLGKPLNQFIEHHFFNAYADHIKLFKQMPSTPFIWHLSSGQHQGFEAFILIYKWNRDSLFKLKSQYLSNRVQNLEYRQLQLQDLNTAQSQSEKETIRLQLVEIDKFKSKIDELIAEGYDPKLDDGVGKNIAPLQKKGLIRAEVLKSNQLTKYLKANW